LAHDVFISHSSKDKAIADAVCAALEAAGIRCWIAPRDIRSGQKWPEAIVNAITSSRVMVLIFSAHSNNSEDVANELTLAMNSRVIVVPFKIDEIAPKGVMQYYLTSTHWLDAMNPPTAKQIQELVQTVTSLISNGKNGTAELFGPFPDKMEGGEVATFAEGSPLIAGKAWFWAGAALLAVWLICAVLALSQYRGGNWGHDSWRLSFFIFLAFSYLILIPAAYGFGQGLKSKLAGATARVSGIWWLLTALGFVGGLLSFSKHKKTNREKAVHMLVLGIVLTPLWFMPLFAAQALKGASMEVIGSWSTSGEANGVFVCGDIAYLANGNGGLVILDISDPSAPKEIKKYPLDNARNVVVSGGIAYVTDEDREGLVILDVENPSQPRELGEYKPGGFVYRSLSNLAVSGSTVFLTLTDRLIIVDVSTPSEPVMLGEFSFNSNISSPGITVFDGIAYVQANQLHMVDISNPANPVEIGRFNTGWGASVQIVNGVAYALSWDEGLTILDVSTPSRPIKLGQFKKTVSNLQLPPGTQGRQVTLKTSVSGSIAYVTYNFGIHHGTWYDTQESGFMAIDVSDPRNPRLLEVFPHLDGASGIFAAGDLVLATDLTRGLYVYSKNSTKKRTDQ
jgi:hypothetical protein